MYMTNTYPQAHTVVSNLFTPWFWFVSVTCPTNHCPRDLFCYSLVLFTSKDNVISVGLLFYMLATSFSSQMRTAPNYCSMHKLIAAYVTTVHIWNGAYFAPGFVLVVATFKSGYFLTLPIVGWMFCHVVSILVIMLVANMFVFFDVAQ